MPDDTPARNTKAPIWDPEVERLDEAECWRLISAGGVGRLAYSGRSGLAVLPVGYQVQEGGLLSASRWAARPTRTFAPG